MNFEMSRLILEELSNIKFHKNPLSGSRFVPCGQTDGQAHRKTELIVAFRSFENALKNFDLNNCFISCT
jgi:hypothetical protein